MKTTTKGFFAIVFALFLFSSMATKAQCSKIVNTTQCTIDVSGELFETDINTGLCTVGCDSFSGTIPKGGTYYIPCGSCGNVCNIKVNIDAIGGAALISYTSADYFNGSSIPGNACSATLIIYDTSVSGFMIY